MATIQSIDVFDGAGVLLSRERDGLHATRVAKVVGLQGEPSQRVLDALFAPGLPSYGEPHPSIPGMHVHNLQVAAIDPTGAEVTISYRSTTQQDDVNTEVGSTLQDVETSFDHEGNLITIQRLVEILDENGDVEDAKFVFQTAKIRVQIPMAVLRISRREEQSPHLKALAHVGHVNATPIWGDRKSRTWLCTRIEGSSDDGGLSYDVIYEFQHAAPPPRFIEDDRLNLGTWDTLITFYDYDKNEHPDDLEIGLGKKTVQTYQTSEFRELDLPVDIQ